MEKITEEQLEAAKIQQINLCNIYLDNFALKSNRWHCHSFHIKNSISKFFDTEISDDAFLAAIKSMFLHRHLWEEHYLVKVRLKPPKPKRIFIGNGSFYQFTENLFECNSIFYKPIIKNGSLVFEQILVNNKNQQKSWD